MEQPKRSNSGMNSESSRYHGPLLAVNVTRQTEVAGKIEVAKSGAKRSKGLLGRKGLEPGSGMWILPCEAIHTFFMRFAIDVVYLDRKLRVKKVVSSLGPWRMSACLSAHSVLELPPGTIEDSQTRTGDLLEFVPVGSLPSFQNPADEAANL